VLIDRKEYEHRTIVLRDRMAEKGIDVFVVSNEASVFYLCGYDPHRGVLFVSRDQSALVIGSPYFRDAQDHAVLTDVFDRGESAYQTAAEILRHSGAKVVGFESKHATAKDCRELRQGIAGLNLKAADDLVLGMREKKSAAEIACLLECSRCAERGFLGMLKNFSVTDTEQQVAAKLDYWMRMNGAQNTSFPVRVAFGANADVPHKMPANGVMVPGGVALFDWGAMIDRYNSDITRLGICQPEGSRWTELHEATIDCVEMLEATVKPGMRCAEAYELAYRQLASFGGEFVFSLGHGIGLEPHEAPHLHRHSQDIFQVGQVVCLEPGLYFYQQGCVRLENMYEVTEDGLRRLTELPYANFSGI
jgi:Xaa-Pro aminopeptidase